jgi:undecaprenyl phosphate-alpha-L-ara4N flippase subunit ArnE
MQSIHKNGIVLMIASSCCVCLGQLLWKLSVNGKLHYLCLGFLLYGAGFICMTTAYKYGSVSKLQPILSINYIFAVLLGFLVFGESITIYKVIGIVIIAISVTLIGSSPH